MDAAEPLPSPAPAAPEPAPVTAGARPISWIQTFTGRRVDLDPFPGPGYGSKDPIVIEDIAHHLALLNRFTGGTRWPFSVAQHSVNVAKHAGCWDGRNYLRPDGGRFGLLHDAAEAYYGDVSSPLKGLLSPRYHDLEQAALVAILVRFDLIDLTAEVERAVKHSDLIMLATEKRDLLNLSGHAWGLTVEPDRRLTGHPLSWRTAEEDYLTHFRLLFGEDR